MPIPNQAPVAPEEATAAPAPAPEEAAETEPTSIFLTKDQVGKEVKPGDVLQFTVKAVDQESGEIEAEAAEVGESEESGESESLGESPMDKMNKMAEMPEGE